MGEFEGALGNFDAVGVGGAFDDLCGDGGMRFDGGGGSRRINGGGDGSRRINGGGGRINGGGGRINGGDRCVSQSKKLPPRGPQSVQSDPGGHMENFDPAPPSSHSSSSLKSQVSVHNKQ
jgi:hypothetical protein